MRCPEFRLAVDDRPANGANSGSARLSPRLLDHLDRCAPCSRWQRERERWGDLGRFFQADSSQAGAPEADGPILRQRVRARIAETSRPARAWRLVAFPAFGAAAAAVLLTVVLVDHRLEPQAPSAPAQEASLSVSTPKALPAAAPKPSEPVQGQAKPQERTPARPKAPAAGARPVRRSGGEPEFKIVRVGDEFGVEWPAGSAREPHRITTSTDPRDFTGGRREVVPGNTWLDTGGPVSAGTVQYYLID